MFNKIIGSSSIKNIFFLVGLMGSGKTFWANSLAKELGIDCIDLDSLIEQEQQTLIPDIFKSKGELFFRNLETKVLKDYVTLNIQSLIVATGGGTPCFNDNLQLMNLNGITIWLDESIDTIIKRVTPRKSERPLIADIDENSLSEYFATLLESRIPFYSKCHHRLVGEQITKENLLKIINQYV